MVYFLKYIEVAVKNLTVILLMDFDIQIKPADKSDKIRYTCRSDIGR